MKSFSPIKSFTPVMFFLVMCLTMIAWAEPAPQTAPPGNSYGGYVPPDPEFNRKQAESDCKGETNFDKCVACKVNSNTDKYDCNNDIKKDCSSAFDKYFDSYDDVNNACSALTNVNTKKKSKTFDPKNECSKKIRECHAQVERASSTNAENPAEQSGAMTDILSEVLSKIGDKTEGDSSSSSGSCMLDYDNKKLEDAEKEYKTAKKDLQKEINDLNKDIITEKKDMDKTHADIDKKVNEFNKDHEKEMRTLDKEMRERLKANSDSLVESGKKVRELSKKMLATQKALKQISFEFEKSKQDTTEQKIALKCSQAIGIAKKCMMDSYKKSAPSTDEQCKNFPKIMGRGTKATAEFKAYLQNISDACYEELNTAKDRASFKNQQATENANEEMTELQAQLKDEQSVQQNAQNDLQKIAQESEREKNELANALAKELETLALEKIKATESATQTVNELNARIVKLKQDLQELEIQKKTGLKSATKVAESALGKSRGLYKRALSACECAGKASPNATKKMCSTLEEDFNPEQIAEKKAKTGQ